MELGSLELMMSRWHAGGHSADSGASPRISYGRNAYTAQILSLPPFSFLR